MIKTTLEQKQVFVRSCQLASTREPGTNYFLSHFRSESKKQSSKVRRLSEYCKHTLRLEKGDQILEVFSSQGSASVLFFLFKGRVHDVKGLELRPEIFRMWVFLGLVSDYDTVESLKFP